MDILKGKVALVTGGASGMGRDVALLFAREGAQVCVADWSDAGGQTVKDITAASGDAFFVKADVSKSDDVKKMIAATVKKYGRLHILANIAGIVAPEISVVDCTEETFMKVINVNLVSVWLGMKYGIPEIEKAGGGAIINFTSIAALEAYKGIPAYAASKGGIISMSRVAAIESASKNIRVNCIAPGHIATPMFLGCWTQEQLKHLESIGPQGRLGRSEEIAQVALFLVSEAASHITATTIVADGGVTARIP